MPGAEWTTECVQPRFRQLLMFSLAIRCNGSAQPKLSGEGGECNCPEFCRHAKLRQVLEVSGSYPIARSWCKFSECLALQIDDVIVDAVELRHKLQQCHAVDVEC